MPKVDDVGLKILFLLLPGIVAFFIIKTIGPKQTRSDFETGIHIFLYGVMAYLLAGMVVGLIDWAAHWYPPSVEQESFAGYIVGDALLFATLNPQSSLPGDHIAYATMMAVVMGVSIANLQTHSVVHRLLRYLHLTKRTGEIDMWGFTLNSSNIESWATVRHTNGKVYQGWVRGYSDGGDERELILTDVKVYSTSLETPQELIEVDSVPIMYLGLDRKGIIIEFIEKLVQ